MSYLKCVLNESEHHLPNPPRSSLATSPLQQTDYTLKFPSMCAKPQKLLSSLEAAAQMVNHLSLSEKGSVLAFLRTICIVLWSYLAKTQMNSVLRGGRVQNSRILDLVLCPFTVGQGFVLVVS